MRNLDATSQNYYQDIQDTGNNREEESRQKPGQTEEPNLPCNQDQMRSSVFSCLPKRADLIVRDAQY